jgi:hypothetical protein
MRGDAMDQYPEHLRICLKTTLYFASSEKSP